MSALRVYMFGRFEVYAGPRPVGTAKPPATGGLCVPVAPPRPALAAGLADAIWGEGEPEQLREALRRSLWKLQNGVGLQAGVLLAMDAEFVEVGPREQLWLDLAEFEAARRAAMGRTGVALDDATAERLRAAAPLYRGDLLEGWYVDWCLAERERLRDLLFEILNKLCAWCAAHGRYAEGLAYGHAALQHDSAHERSHRHIMWLHHLAGDRCAAIRQYHRCVQVLRDQGGAPSARTVACGEPRSRRRLVLRRWAAAVGSAARAGRQRTGRRRRPRPF